VIVQLSRIYGSKPTKFKGESLRTRFVYVCHKSLTTEQCTRFVSTAMYIIGP